MRSENIREIQKLLGHRSIKTTEIYLHLSEHHIRYVVHLMPGPNLGPVLGTPAILPGRGITQEVKKTLDMAIARTGVKHIHVYHRPRLLSNNGPCFISHELKDYLEDHNIRHIRTRTYHPMTQGKIEHYHRSITLSCWIIIIHLLSLRTGSRDGSTITTTSDTTKP